MKRLLYIGGLGVSLGMLPLLGTGTLESASLHPVQEMEFSYGVIVRDIPRETKTLEIWVPLPREDGWQSISNLRVESPVPFLQLTESEYGNRLLYCDLTSDLPDSLPFTVTFHVRRAEAVPLAPLDTGAVLERQLRRFLAPDALVPITGAIAHESDSVAAGESTPIAKALALYRHVLGTMRYDKTGIGWGDGSAVFACEQRRGNCTDIHSLLIGMARAQGIPARFVIGFPTPSDVSEGVIPGYHCWAELYVPDLGWVPVDASEAIKHPRKAAFYFGNLDENRVAFTVGRDIRLEGRDRSVTANYFIYPEVRLDGLAYTNVAREFKFRVLRPAGG